MDENCVINIFIPHHIISPRHVLCGVVQNFPKYAVVNCIDSLSCDQCDFVVKISELCSYVIKGYGRLDGRCLGVVGFISDYTSRHLPIDLPGEINGFSKDLHFLLCVDSEMEKFDVEKVQMGNHSHYAKQIRLILYDAKDLLLSRILLGVERTAGNENLETFGRTSVAEFLKYTTAAFAQLTGLSDIKDAAPSSPQQFIDKVLYCLPILVYNMMVFVVFQYEYFYALSVRRVPSVLSTVAQLSSVGKHVLRRLHHVHQITRSISKEKFPISCGNLISAILFDLLCGWIFTYLFWQCCSPPFLLEIALKYTNIVVNHLPQILHWLMGAPAGLKLNIPLNTALGHFFLYHIYLWKTYMMVVKPIFAFVLEGVAILGLFGFTFIMCLLNDVISMATIHIYCFYGYAARLYGYQISGLTSLWRLFRGKKWNPLRQRIDSFTYDVQQMYVGTLFFTILIFLLPTVMAYYVVFTSLRIVVLTVQGVVTRVINLLTTFPLYVIFLRVCNSKLITGDVYFSVLQEQKVLVLNMELVQIPVQSAIQRTQPEDAYKEEPLSWKAFWDSLVWGRILYPI